MTKVSEERLEELIWNAKKFVNRINAPWSQTDPEDVLQEAAMKAWRNRDRINDITAKAYVNQAALSASQDSWKRRRFHLDRSMSIVYADRHESPSNLDASLSQMYVWGKLGELPVPYREAMQCRLQDMNAQEAAKALGITIPAYKSRLYRACALLRASVLRDREANNG